MLLLGAARSAPAQIVNTLSGFTDVPGWSGLTEATFARSGGNTDVLTQRSTWSLSLGGAHMVEREEIRELNEPRRAQRLSTTSSGTAI
jgi:hypothetical protein